MIFRTKNSLYEIWIEENKIRKLGGRKNDSLVGSDWIIYDYMPYPPKIGRHFVLIFSDENSYKADIFSTTLVVEIIKNVILK